MLSSGTHGYGSKYVMNEMTIEAVHLSFPMRPISSKIYLAQKLNSDLFKKKFKNFKYWSPTGRPDTTPLNKKN